MFDIIKKDGWFEVELQTDDKDQRLGVRMDEDNPDHFQIYYKGWNQNAEIWERRMHSIEVKSNDLVNIIGAVNELIKTTE
jgi:hypothetical protein